MPKKTEALKCVIVCKFFKNLNGAGSGTGDIEMRPDSQKLFERKNYGIQLKSDAG